MLVELLLYVMIQLKSLSFFLLFLERIIARRDRVEVLQVWCSLELTALMFFEIAALTF